MTVSSSTNQATFPGNGVTTVFPLPFRFFENSDIAASLIDANTGEATPLSLGVNYTLSGAAEPEVDGNAVSELTMVTAPASGINLFVERVMDVDQPTDIVNQGRFFPQIHENVFDRLTMLIQQVSSGLRGAIRVAIGDPEPKRLPPVSQRANLLMGFDSAGDPIAVAPASGSAAELAMNLANDTDPSKGAGMLGYKGRTVYERLSDLVTVKDFGAVGDGVTDDTESIQDAIDAVMSAGGGALYFPAGTYKTTGQLLIDLSANVQRFAGRIHLIGAGMPATCIKTTGAYTAIRFKGAPTIYEAYFNIEGMRLEGPSLLAGSYGIVADGAVAFCNFKDLCIEQFQIGLACTDMEQIGVYNCFIRFNEQGIVGNAASIATSANSWSFYNTLVASNTLYGVSITNANALNWNGGSIQYNGYIGAGASGWGIKLVEAGDGYGTVGLSNMILEGNGGVADLVSVQDTYACQMDLDNVCFMRTVNFRSATITGAANNGLGAIRLAVDSTAALAGKPKVMITGVVGTTEANNAVPWSFTIIDGTHIDLTGSTFTNAYVSGGIVSVVGFADHNILVAGSNLTPIYSIEACAFRSALGYLPSATRPTIKLDNAGARIADDGSNYFQNAAEKLTYIQLQQIGDDGSAWAVIPTTVTAAGGTFSATGTLRIKKIGKTVHFSLDALTTSYAATPTAPVSFTVPFPAASRTAFAGINSTTLNSLVAIVQAAGSSVSVYAQTGAFPVTANSQRVVVSGSYETTA